MSDFTSYSPLNSPNTAHLSVAFRGGSVSEVLEDGVTALLVNSVAEAIEATRHVNKLDRRRCRENFDRRFSVTRMATDYVELYTQLIERRQSAADPGALWKMPYASTSRSTSLPTPSARPHHSAS